MLCIQGMKWSEYDSEVVEMFFRQLLPRSGGGGGGRVYPPDVRKTVLLFAFCGAISNHIVTMYQIK